MNTTNFRLGPFVIAFLLGVLASSFRMDVVWFYYLIPLVIFVLLGIFRWPLYLSFLWKIAACTVLFALGGIRGELEQSIPVKRIAEWNGEVRLTQPFTSTDYGYKGVGECDLGRLVLYGSSVDASLGAGSVLNCRGRVSPFSEAIYPFQFDANQFYLNQGIVGKLSISEFHVTKRVQSSLRTSFVQRISSWPVSDRTKSFYLAMLAGDKSDISESDRTAFANSGIVHVLAVSGLHVGLLMYMLNFLTGWGWFKRSKVGKWLRSAFVLLGLWGFVYLTGFGSSVVRSGTMFTLIYLASLYKAEGSTKEAIWFSAFIICLFDPNQLFQLGFQLSYLAVIGIVYGHGITSSWIRNVGRERFYRKPIQYLLNGLSVSLWAQLTTLPIILYYFHSFPNYFLLNNLLFLPFIPVLLFSGIVTVLIDVAGFDFLWHYQVLDMLVQYFFSAVEFMGSLPNSVSSNIYITAFAAVLLLVAVLWIIIALHRRKWQLYIPILPFCIGIWLTWTSNEPHTTWLHQTGEHQYLEITEGRTSYLYGNDVQADYSFLKASAEWRKSRGVDSILLVNTVLPIDYKRCNEGPTKLDSELSILPTP